MRILFLSDTPLGFDLPSRPRTARRRRGDNFFQNHEWALEPARHGDVVAHADVEPDTMLPIPPGQARSVMARREAFTLARFDRLRILSTELKRLAAAAHAAAALRTSSAPPLADGRLASVLWWV